jgi:glycosyltransferase involved in cell wall biosynthesis
MSRRPRLAFVSPVFLFPNDTGGRIRTTNILRGLRRGSFDVTLLMPATAAQRAQWAARLDTLCHRLVAWEPTAPRSRWTRARDLARQLPVSVVSDRSPAALAAVRDTLAREAFDVVVFDFVHSAVLRPAHLEAPTVCFTHNVEAEIFSRHAAHAGSALMRAVWSSQCEKMRRFEARSLCDFTSVVAVSERDAAHFREHYGVRRVDVIPTGVDLDYFAWQAPPANGPDRAPHVVFTGSMDWEANVDGVQFFIEAVWPAILDKLPEARFTVVGRSPPAALVQRARGVRGVSFTGYVDDVRPHVRDAHVFVIPLRIGGGTRIKAFEAMALGCPVVSTSVGIEGLDVAAGEHYLRADAAPELAAAIVGLLQSPSRREALSAAARHCVESRFGHGVAANVFEQACLRAMRGSRADVARELALEP